MAFFSCNIAHPLSCLNLNNKHIFQWFAFRLDQVWSTLPALELLPPTVHTSVNSQGGATPMQANRIQLDLLSEMAILGQSPYMAFQRFKKCWMFCLQCEFSCVIYYLASKMSSLSVKTSERLLFLDLHRVFSVHEHYFIIGKFHKSQPFICNLTCLRYKS